MFDQASALREVVKASSLRQFEELQSQHQPVAIAITSGKGGVGKTNIVANLAAVDLHAGIELKGVAKLVREVSEASGVRGMIGGQTVSSKWLKAG